MSISGLVVVGVTNEDSIYEEIKYIFTAGCSCYSVQTLLNSRLVIQGLPTDCWVQLAVEKGEILSGQFRGNIRSTGRVPQPLLAI